MNTSARAEWDSLAAVINANIAAAQIPSEAEVQEWEGNGARKFYKICVRRDSLLTDHDHTQLERLLSEIVPQGTSLLMPEMDDEPWNIEVSED